MAYAQGRSEASHQLDYQSLSRGGANGHNMRFPANDAMPEYGLNSSASDTMQRSHSYAASQPALFLHQQLQQQQHQQNQHQQGPYGIRPHDPFAEQHEVERRSSMQPRIEIISSSTSSSSSGQLPASTQSTLRTNRPVQPIRTAQPHGPTHRHQPLSLRQQVLTPTFPQHGQFGAPGTSGHLGHEHGSVPTGGGIVMSRSSSLPTLYGQHQPGLDFHSPALSIDSAATFMGPTPSIFEGYSRPSSASTSFYSTGMHLSVTASSDGPSPDPCVAAASAAAAAASSVSGDMSFDLSGRSFDCSMTSTGSTAMTSLPSTNTTLCELSSQPKFSPEESFSMVLPGSSFEHPMSNRMQASNDPYDSHRAGILPFGAPLAIKQETYGPNALGLMNAGGMPARPEPPLSLNGAREFGRSTHTEGEGQTSDHNAVTTRIPHAHHRPAIPPSEGTNYSIDALLAITRAAEADPSVFPCPLCDKSYEGKHARSIWRRHLQDKHAIPLSAQPRRTRWDSDVNRPKNAEERRQRMLESKRRWAQKRRKQKHLEAEAKAAAAAAAAAVAEAEKCNMADSVIEQMRAWYEHAKAQVIDVTTPGWGHHFGSSGMFDSFYATDGSGGGGGMDMHGNHGEGGGGGGSGVVEVDEEGLSECEEIDEEDEKMPSTSGPSKAVTPGRPTLAEASGISPNSPFALPAWLDQQPPSLRAAALAAIQAQRAQARSKRKAAEASELAAKHAAKRKAGGETPGMSRTLSLPVSGSLIPHQDSMKRTYSQQAQSSSAAWDPFLAPALPGRGIPGSTVGLTDANAKMPRPMLAMMGMQEPPAQQHSMAGGRISPYHHVGGIDHSPTPAGRRAAAVAGVGPMPMMSSSSLASSPTAAIRAPLKMGGGRATQGAALALHHSMGGSSSTEELRSGLTSSPTSLGAAIALGVRQAAPASGSADPANSASAQNTGHENPFSLEKHKISPTQPPGASSMKRQTALQESPRPVLNRATSVKAEPNAGSTDEENPPFGVSRHLPPLPGLNERSLGVGEDPMVLGASTSGRPDDGLSYGGLEIDTPMRHFGNVFPKPEPPSVAGTPRNQHGRQRELSGLSASYLGLGVPLPGTTSSALQHPVPPSSIVVPSLGKSSGMAPLATPDRYTRPRGLSSVLRNLGGGTPSAGLRFNLNESPHSALMSMSAGMVQAHASSVPSSASTSAGSTVVGSNGPLSVSKSWGTLSSAMLDWPTSGGVELSPIRPKVPPPPPLMERRDGSNTVWAGMPVTSTPYARGGPPSGPADGSSNKALGSPTQTHAAYGSKSGSDSGAGSPVLRPSTSTSSSASAGGGGGGNGMSALGAALTRPRGLSKSLVAVGTSWSMSSGGSSVRTEISSMSTSVKRTWDAENGPAPTLALGNDWKRVRA